MAYVTFSDVASTRSTVMLGILFTSWRQSIRVHGDGRPQFLPRDASAERGDATVSRPSVCPSVCLSVRDV